MYSAVAMTAKIKTRSISQRAWLISVEATCGGSGSFIYIGELATKRYVVSWPITIWRELSLVDKENK